MKKLSTTKHRGTSYILNKRNKIRLNFCKEIFSAVWQADLRHKGLAISAILLIIVAGFFVARYAKAVDGSGTNTVTPTTAVAGSTSNTHTFTFTAAETMNSGEISINAPSGFSVPQGTSGVAGYTTVTSASGIIANVLDNANTTTGWTAGTACNNGFTIDGTIKNEGTNSIVCINGNESNNDGWYKNITAQNWATYTQIGFWIRTSASVVAGHLVFTYDDSANIASPIEELSIPALSATTWTYVTLNFGATTRSSILSYGFKIKNPAGLDNKTVWIDDILIGPGSPIFSGTGDVNARLLQLASGQTVVFTYGLGGGVSGVTAPSSAGTYTFITKTRASDSGVLTNIASSPTITVGALSATKFVIINPTDGTVDLPISVTVQAQLADNSIDTSYQNDVTLVVDGSATGGGLVDIINGVGTLSISDHTPETVNLSLSDSQGTGLNVSSTQNVIFSPGAVSQFSLNNPGDMVVSTRLGYTVTRKDQYGNLVTSGTTAVYLYSSSFGANKRFYDAASGGNIITSIAITNGNSTADFWYYDETAGTYTITTSDNAVFPDGTTSIDDATDSVVVGSVPIVATKFTILDPVDTVVGGSAVVIVRAEDNSGNLDTTYQNDVTLVVSGSATGGGLVNIVNGIGTKTITNNTAETVNLTLSDSQSTGLDVSSVQNILFVATASELPVIATTLQQQLNTVIKFYGRAYPGATVTVLAKSGNQEVPLQQQSISAADGSFGIEIEGLFSGYYSYGLKINDKDGRATPAKFYDLDLSLYSVTDKNIFAAPTLSLVKEFIFGKSITLSGYATPKNEIKIEVDGKAISDFAIADDTGFYRISINIKNLSQGSHTVRVRQSDNRLGQISDWSLLAPFTVSASEMTETDFNADGIIDIKDWSIFLSYWGKSGDERKKIDLNGDGGVDISDFSLFITTFKKL